jgi:hypothetical protein
MCPEFPDFAGGKVGSTANKAKDIAAVWNRASKRVDVYMVDMNNRMWHSPQGPDGSFPDFAQRPVGTSANKALRISAVSLGDGRRDVYMVGLDNQMWHSVQKSDGTFPDFAGAMVGSTANKAKEIAAVWHRGRVDVYMVGMDNRMWHSVQGPDGSFPDFAQRPVGTSANKALRISVASLGGDFPASDVYMVGLDNQMWHSVQGVQPWP